MSETKDNSLEQDPAFTCSDLEYSQYGMSKRELIAKDAMCALIAAMPHSKEDTIFFIETMVNVYDHGTVPECIAKEALLYTDALLKELKDGK